MYLEHKEETCSFTSHHFLTLLAHVYGVISVPKFCVHKNLICAQKDYSLHASGIQEIVSFLFFF